MKSSASNGGRLDASETRRYLSRTRQGVSVVSKERRHWHTQTLTTRNERKDSSMHTKANLSKGTWLQLNERRATRTGMLLLLLLLTSPAAVQAQFNYTTNSGTITITKY